MRTEKLLPIQCLAGAILVAAQVRGQNAPLAETLLLLGRPTDHSVTLNVLSPTDANKALHTYGDPAALPHSR